MLLLQARCEAMANQHEKSLETLRTAVDKGFMVIEVLMQAEEFAEVQKLPGYAALVEEIRSKVEEVAGPAG
jgi:hypothetical protein